MRGANSVFTRAITWMPHNDTVVTVLYPPVASA